MNACTPVVREDEEASCDVRYSIATKGHGDVTIIRNRGVAAVVGGVGGPVGALAPMAGNQSAAPGDAWIRSLVVAALQEGAWLAPELIGVSVVGGVVYLSGEIDSVHGDLATCRIAAMVPGTKAIIDDLFMRCE